MLSACALCLHLQMFGNNMQKAAVLHYYAQNSKRIMPPDDKEAAPMHARLGTERIPTEAEHARMAWGGVVKPPR